MAIPASTIVSVTPSVLSPGGAGLSFAGLFLTQNTVVPIGAPTSFYNITAVGNYFGTSSTEYAMAKVYFQGFDTSTVKPGLLWFAQYPYNAVAAYLRGASPAAIATLNAITAGSLSVTINGTAKSTTTLNLSSASSYSAVASAIGSALGLSGGQTCVYNSQFGAFVITSGSTGSTSSISFASSGSSNVAALIGLTQTSGAVLSQGADAVTDQGAFMTSLVAYTNNWVSFTTTWEPTLAVKEVFATWVGGQGNRYLYVPYDTDATVIGSPSVYTGFGYWLKQNSISGVAPVYNDVYTAAMICGIPPSLDFTRLNGRADFMFRTNSQVPAAIITDQTSYQNMIANGYSAYCQFGVQTSPNMLANGQVSGAFLWLDSYIGAIWLAVNLQQSMVTLLQQTPSIPYNSAGYALIKSAALDTINSALNFGIIRANVKPSASEAAQMNAAAGLPIDSYVGTRGWYFQVADATATTRAARQSPPVSLWYMDGQSVQQINISSVDVL